MPPANTMALALAALLLGLSACAGGQVPADAPGAHYSGRYRDELRVVEMLRVIDTGVGSLEPQPEDDGIWERLMGRKEGFGGDEVVIQEIMTDILRRHAPELLPRAQARWREAESTEK